MSAGGRYLTGVALVVVAAAVLVLAVPPRVQTPIGWGAAMGLLLQAPLGWWVVRSIGTDRFLPVWGFGMLTRFMSVLVVGFLAQPRLGRGIGPLLGAMVGVLVALLLVEGVTALREYSREDKR